PLLEARIESDQRLVRARVLERDGGLVREGAQELDVARSVDEPRALAAGGEYPRQLAAELERHGELGAERGEALARGGVAGGQDLRAVVADAEEDPIDDGLEPRAEGVEKEEDGEREEDGEGTGAGLEDDLEEHRRGEVRGADRAGQEEVVGAAPHRGAAGAWG